MDNQKNNGTSQIGATKKDFDKKKIIKVYVVAAVIMFFITAHIATMLNDGISLSQIEEKLISHMLFHPMAIRLTAEEFGYIALGIFALGVFALSYIDRAKKRLHDAAGIEKGSAEWHEWTKKYVMYGLKPIKIEGYEDYNRTKTDPPQSVDNNGYNNILLSKNVALSLDNKEIRRNANTIVMGGSGTGKSFGVIKPNILQMNCTFIATDPKGELLQDTGKALRQEGYDIRVFNLKEMQYSDGYNPLSYIRTDSDVVTLASCIMENTQKEGSKPDAFFDAAAEALLQAIIFLLWKRYPDEANLSRVIELVTAAKVDETDGSSKTLVDRLFEKEKREHEDSIAYKQYQVFRSGSPKTVNSIVSTLGVRLTAFNVPEVKRLTSRDTIRLDEIGTKRIALFLIVPTGESIYNFLGAMMYTQLFSLLYFKAENEMPNKYFIYNYMDRKIFVKKKKPLPILSDIPIINWIPVFSKYEYKTIRNKYRYLSLHDSEKEAKKHITKYKHAKLRTDSTTGICSIVYRDKNGVEEVLKTFDSGDVKNNKRLCRQWAKFYKNCYVEKGGIYLPEHVRFLLDEFKNIGKIPKFNNRLSTVRSYNISITIVYQSLSQLKGMFEKEWGEVMDNCDSIIYLGGQGTETAEEIQKLLGSMTIKTKSDSLNNAKNKGGSESYSPTERPLAYAAELIRTDSEDSCVVMVRNVKPFREWKYNLFDHPNYKLIKNNPYLLHDEYRLQAEQFEKEKRQAEKRDEERTELLESEENGEQKEIRKNKSVSESVPAVDAFKKLGINNNTPEELEQSTATFNKKIAGNRSNEDGSISDELFKSMIAVSDEDDDEEIMFPSVS